VVDEGESEDDDDFIVDEEGRPIQRDRVKFNLFLRRKKLEYPMPSRPLAFIPGVK
jgi:hypothetical protein